MTDLVDRLSRTASSVTERGKQWLESTKLRKDLEDTQRRRGEALVALGEVAYQQLRKGTLAAEGLAAQAKVIQELDQREGLLRQQIETLETPSNAPGSCPRCGRNRVPGDRFCVGCGGHLKDAPVGAPSCGACGAELKPEASFCVRCGTPRPAEGA